MNEIYVLIAVDIDGGSYDDDSDDTPFYPEAALIICRYYASRKDAIAARDSLLSLPTAPDKVWLLNMPAPGEAGLYVESTEKE